MRPLLLLKGRRFCRPLLTAVIIFFSCYISNAQASGRGEESTVTFKGRDVPLSDLFKAIKKQTGYTVMYSLSVTQLDGKEKVTVDFNKAGIVEVMAYVLKGRNLVWTIVDESILIYKEDEVKKNIAPTIGVKEKSDTVINAVLPMVVGKVTDAEDKPLADATVIVKGTKDGAITDKDGIFYLSNISENAAIVVTSLGYSPREVTVSRKTIQIKMNIAVNELDETIVIGYGLTSRRLSTGNIAVVSKEQIERQPVMNVLSTLQGRVPGLEIKQNSGYASAPFKVEIRGRSVIGNRVSEPLYIIDGVPLTMLLSEQGGNYASGSLGVTQNGFHGPAGGQSPLFSINPADVESISVLKDADATAIYGSRGANGVILITTKKGKPGKARLEVNIYHGISKVTGRHRTLNTQQYLTVRREAFYNDSIKYGITPDLGNAYDLLSWDTTRYTDFQKEMWGGVGKTTDVQAAITGGDNFTTFRVGGTYHRETSILNYTGADQRASVHFNLSHKSQNGRLSMSFTSQYSYTRSDLVAFPGNVVTIAPNAPAFLDASGRRPNYNGWLPVPEAVESFSALFEPYTAKTSFLNSQLKLQYELLKGFNFSTSFGYSYSHNGQNQIYPIGPKNPLLTPTGASQFGNNNNQNAILEPQLEYNGFIGKGKLNALLGGSLQTASQEGNTITGTGYVNDNLLRSISNAPIKTAGDNFAQYKYIAAFARINYNWKDKFIVNLSGRRDGSSKFGPNNRFGNFGAVGAAWIFTEEPWLEKQSSWLSFGKLRASYGITGSDNIGDYTYLNNWSSGQPFQNSTIPAYIPLNHANPDLQWQVNKKLEAAMGIGFLKDRLYIEVAWYRNRCGNQLLNTLLPSATGFGVVTQNLPAVVQNRGIEVQFRAKLAEKRDFDWSFNFNIGINRNKLVAYPGLEESIHAGSLIIGQPLNITRLLHYTGVDPLTGEYTYEDRNKDGIINTDNNDPANDLYVKDLNGKFSGGFGTDLQYKGWQINLLFAYIKQILPSSIYGSTPGQIENIAVEVLDRWQKPGDKAEFARYTTQPSNSDSYFFNSDAPFSDGSYIRLRNLSLSYDLTENWAKKAGLRTCRIYMRGENLFILTKYRGLDPDTPGFGTMPPAKVFTCGIQFSF